jgi:hypothetical protein
MTGESFLNAKLQKTTLKWRFLEISKLFKRELPEKQCGVLRKTAS